MKYNEKFKSHIFCYCATASLLIYYYFRIRINLTYQVSTIFVFNR